MSSQQLDSPQHRHGRPITTMGVLRTVARGIVGGLVATAIMTLYRFPVFRALPPTAEFWAMYVAGGEPEQYPLEGLVLHFAYGGAAGGLFGFGYRLVDRRTDGSLRYGRIALAVGYSLLLSVFGTRVIFRGLLGEELDADERLVFHVGHVVYGLTLGTWLSSRERSGEVYE